MTIHRRLWGYLQLVRFPNLFTIPGDILVGAFLVTLVPAYPLNSPFSYVVSLSILVLSSLFIYSFGLVQNDLIGYAEDLKLGRKRPLTTHLVSIAEAKVFAVVLLLLALLTASLVNVATLIVALSLLFTVTIYNYLNKVNSFLAPFVMGGCRGLNIALGASVVGWHFLSFDPYNFYVWIAIIFHTLFISAVTLFARDEALGKVGRFTKLLPALIAIGFAIFMHDFYFVIFAVMTFLTTVPILKRATADEIGQVVGRFIQSLIFIQAIWLVLLGVNFFTLCFVFMLFFLHGHFSKWFYSS
jgi:4-hydroxybenzoate polyprenyltransferase